METLYVLETDWDRPGQWHPYALGGGEAAAYFRRSRAEEKGRQATAQFGADHLRIREYQLKVKLATPKVVITVGGGNIQDIFSSRATKVAVIDYDTEGAEESELTAIPQDAEGESHENAYARINEVPVDLSRVRQLFTAIEQRQRERQEGV